MLSTLLLTATLATAQTQKVTQITFERTPCRGHCPSFKAVLYPNGTIEYVGGRNVPRLGLYKATMLKGDWEHLVEAADRLGYYTAKPSDDETMDVSRVRSSITRAGKTYATDYLTNPPTAIWAFNSLVETTINAAYDWRKAK